MTTTNTRRSRQDKPTIRIAFASVEDCTARSAAVADVLRQAAALGVDYVSDSDIDELVTVA